MNQIAINVTTILTSLIMRTGVKDVKVLWMTDYEDNHDSLLRYRKQIEAALRCPVVEGRTSNDILLEHKILFKDTETDIEIQIVEKK